MNTIIEQDAKEACDDAENYIKILEGKSVLITGASGMIGSYLANALIYANKYIFKKPVELFLITRAKHCELNNSTNIHFIQHDIKNPIPKSLKPDYIIHAASKAAPKIYDKHKIDTLNSNILGLYNLIESADKNLRNLLYISSGEIYGEMKNSKPITENYFGAVNHLSKRSCYVEGKRAGEVICMNYFWEKNTPVTIARLFHTFGPGMNLEDGRVFSDFTNDAIHGRNICIKGDATIRRPLLYLKDAVVMLLMLLTSTNTGQVYNIANKSTVSVQQFAKHVCEVYNKTHNDHITVEIKPTKNKYYKNAVKQIYPSISKFEQEFSFSPKVSLMQMIQRTLAYYVHTSTSPLA